VADVTFAEWEDRSVRQAEKAKGSEKVCSSRRRARDCESYLVCRACTSVSSLLTAGVALRRAHRDRDVSTRETWESPTEWL
jgi:hypothetical protein